MMLEKGTNETETHNRYSAFGGPNSVAGASKPAGTKSYRTVQRWAMAVEDEGSSGGWYRMR
jgi:hypothetical protein